MLSQPSILVVYNEPVLPPDHPDAEAERDILETLEDVVKILGDAGFAVRQLGINLDPQPLLDEVRRHRPDAIFNLFEGVPTRPGTEISAAALIEWLGLPFTGCPSYALALGRDKVRSKHLMMAGGIPTARYTLAERDQIPEWNGAWPVIVKPAYEDASVGIDQASVVMDQARLAARAQYVFDKYGPVALVEEFIPGREFHVNVLEESDGSLTVLPPAEIAFRSETPGRWSVYTYTAKWDENSEEYKDCPLIAPVELPPEVVAQLRGIATRAFRLFHCRDFARIDVRMGPQGNLFVLEMNPNPYLISLALVRGLEAVGRSHQQLVVEMALAALARGGVQVKPGSIKIPAGGVVLETEI